MIQGLRPPRIMVIGRSRAGKSSLINAICGLKVAEVSDTKPETGKAEWKNYYHNGTDLLHILDTRGLQESKAPRQSDSAGQHLTIVSSKPLKKSVQMLFFFV